MDISDLARHAASDVVIEAYPERGFNFRMTDMQAALGLCQLRVLDWILERRRVLAERYTAALEGIPHLEAPYDPPYATRTWQSYCVRLGPAAPIGRNRADAAAAGRRHRDTPRGDGHPPGGLLRRGRESRPRHARAHRGGSARDVMLPLFPDLTEDEQDHVIERLAASVLARAA